jgi:hypothetical protein
VPAHDHQVALDPIHAGDARKKSQGSNPIRSNKRRLGSLCPKMHPTNAVAPSSGADAIAFSTKLPPTPALRNFSLT